MLLISFLGGVINIGDVFKDAISDSKKSLREKYGEIEIQYSKFQDVNGLLGAVKLWFIKIDK